MPTISTPGDTPPEPAHLRILRALRTALGEGHYPIGERLPPERELAASFGVSRMTLRQALATLEDEGALLRRTGRGGGNFVVDPPLELHGLPALSEQLRGLALRAGTRVVEAVERPAAPGEVATLGDGPVLALRRLRYANGRVLGLEQAVLPAEPYPGLLSHPLAGSLHELICREYSAVPVRAVEHLEPTVARPTEAALLETAPGAPLLLVRRVAHGADGRALEYSHDLYRGDRLRVTWSSQLPVAGRARGPAQAGPLAGMR
ncbi:MAG TPA: GntR family transcriptional regulator [Acidimicrobiales bacterium]|nr:GntR family transcriptional regulator [Acidimicrobiales bacterium]